MKVYLVQVSDCWEPFMLESVWSSSDKAINRKELIESKKFPGRLVSIDECEVDKGDEVY